MITTTQALLLLTAAAGTLAMPAKNTFSIQQVRNPNYTGKNGYLEAHKSFRKYGKTIPHGLATKVQHIQNQRKVLKAGAAGGGGSGSAGTNSQSDELWLTPVTIGGKEITLDFDTGSSDLWITKEAWQSAGSGAGEIMDGETWQIRYGDGSSASGNVYQGPVTCGGFKVDKQAIEVAEQSSGDFGNGLLGLGMTSINTVQPDQQSTWVDNACKNGLAECVFTADLGAGDKPGSYNFGYVDSSYGEINKVDIDNSGGWYMFDVSGDGGKATVIADTGTTLLMLPQGMADAYWSKNGGTFDSSQGVYTVDDCSKLEDYTFKINGVSTTVPAEYMCLDDGQGGMIGAMTAGCGGTGSDDPCILGDTWLKAVYAVFGLGDNYFGWSQKVGGGSGGGDN